MTEFSETQFALAYPDGIENHWWNLARNKIILSVVKEFSGPNSVVLEVGCGRGITVNYLKNKGIDCTGVELAEVQPIFSARGYVHSGVEAQNLPYAQRIQYNTILLLDVIEHISNPVSFLQQLLVAFPNASHIIVSVPARHELWSNYDEFYGHYRRYTLEMLKDIAVQLQAGFSYERYFFRLTYPILWIMANFGKNREIKLSAPQSKLVRLIHNFLYRIILLDYTFLPKHTPGTSALAYFFLDRKYFISE